ncbi:MAG: TIGR03905 family TSCPD domain-containing protein [Clostridia bacterium]|nr:TIGR03905 family TSCPD domain-containing protein [Clostridia bacterium]
MFEYKTKGVCARRIFVELDGNVVKSVKFEGGCNGNTKGISKLVEGMTVEEVVDRLTGIGCGFKATSCPDQLAKAVSMAYNNG